MIALHTLDDLASELWVLTHEDLRNTARIIVLMDFLRKDIPKAL